MRSIGLKRNLCRIYVDNGLTTPQHAVRVRATREDNRTI